MQLSSWILASAIAVLPAIAHGATFSVRAGGMVAASPARTAPSIELASSVGLGSERTNLETSLSAWTLPSEERAGARTELTAVVAPAWNGRITSRFGWVVGAGPALRFADGAVAGPDWNVGVGVTPGLTMATRRRSLTLDLGGRGLFFFNDSPRLSLVVGATYAFR